MQHDRQLAQQITAGNPKAFAAFVDTYGPRLHRLACRYAPCKADAEDLTQEIFISLYRSMASFRGNSSLSTWSYRIALNHCLKHAAQVHPATVPFDEALVGPESDERGPVRQTARRELADNIHSALDNLSPDHREIVILHELHEMTYAECAAILQIPLGTVKSRLSHAFRRLRVSLSDYVLSDALPESAP